MSDLIDSRLWKANLLSENSTYFPRLVRAAAFYLGKPYTDHMLQAVSTNPDLLDAMPIKSDEGVDATIAGFASTAGGALDSIILGAVEAYTEPQVTNE